MSYFSGQVERNDARMADPVAAQHFHVDAGAEGLKLAPPLGPSDALRAAGQPDESAAPAPDEPASVLVVDDDPAVREVLSAILREEGYGVSQCSSADAALAHLSGLSQLPVVLSDMKMPDHDGQWLLDQVLQRHPLAAVVMLTG